MADEPRVNVNVRILPSSLKWLDDMAHSTRRRRSTVIRVALAVARRHDEEVARILRETS